MITGKDLSGSVIISKSLRNKSLVLEILAGKILRFSPSFNQESKGTMARYFGMEHGERCYSSKE